MTWRPSDSFLRCKPIDPRRGLYCPNARQSASSIQGRTVKHGDAILYRESWEGCSDGAGPSRFARVLEAVDRFPDGTTPTEPHIIVLVLGDGLHHAYTRIIPAASVCTLIGALDGATALWVLTGVMGSADETERASHYGVLSDHYIEGYLNGDTLAFDRTREKDRKAE